MFQELVKKMRLEQRGANVVTAVARQRSSVQTSGGFRDCQLWISSLMPWEAPVGFKAEAQMLIFVMFFFVVVGTGD